MSCYTCQVTTRALQDKLSRSLWSLVKMLRRPYDSSWESYVILNIMVACLSTLMTCSLMFSWQAPFGKFSRHLESLKTIESCCFLGLQTFSRKLVTNIKNWKWLMPGCQRCHNLAGNFSHPSANSNFQPPVAAPAQQLHHIPVPAPVSPHQPNNLHQPYTSGLKYNRCLTKRVVQSIGILQNQVNCWGMHGILVQWMQPMTP